MSHIDIKKGPIGSTLIKLSVPVLAGQVFNLLYNLVDTWFIARIDTTDPWLVGATGLVFPIFFLFMATMFGISGGISSLVARAIGAGRSAELGKTIESGLALAIAAGILVLAIFYPTTDYLLGLFGGTDLILEYGKSYLLWILPAAPFMFLNAVFMGVLQGEGRTKHMMMAMLSGTLVNIILDPILIFSAGMGIAGAGFATSIGNMASFVYLLVVFLKTGSEVTVEWKWQHVSLPVIAEILRVGIPHSLINFLSSISFIFYNRIMIAINPMILTSFTLYSRIEQFSLVPIWSMMGGLGAIAGQAAGAGDFSRMRQSARTASIMGLVINGSLLALYVLFGNQIFMLFQSDAEVLSIARIILPWMAGGTFVSVPIFMIGTVMTSAGFASRNLALTAIRIYALNVPACAIAAALFRGQLAPVMAAIFGSAIIALFMMIGAHKVFMNGLESGRLTIKYGAKQAG